MFGDVFRGGEPKASPSKHTYQSNRALDNAELAEPGGCNSRATMTEANSVSPRETIAPSSDQKAPLINRFRRLWPRKPDRYLSARVWKLT
jgi:hypothetical protein